MTAGAQRDSQAAKGDRAGRAAAPHVLVTLDAIGGVWRYAMDLAEGLTRAGYRFTFAGLGPRPSPQQQREAEALGRLHWLDAPLDWTAEAEAELDVIPDLLQQLVAQSDVDLVHLNLPSQACALELDVPVLVVSHSCVVTWFAAVRQSPVPADWQWQYRRNRSGFDVASAVLAPSRSHAEMLRASYGAIGNLDVVYNGSRPGLASAPKDNVVFAAGRWWDEGKNGAVLDRAARHTAWPVIMAGSVRGPNGQYFAIEGAEAPGELAHGEVLHRMSRAAVVASPSIYEPFGLAPLEAAQAGAALVLSDIPTYRELWEGAALFAPADDDHAFAAALNSLAEDPALRDDLAARARRRAQDFTLERQATAMQAVYDRLLRPATALSA